MVRNPMPSIAQWHNSTLHKYCPLKQALLRKHGCVSSIPIGLLLYFNEGSQTICELLTNVPQVPWLQCMLQILQTVFIHGKRQ